ncbi:(2Fe-2S)-binding protein [Streptomyces sp. AV19]|uniref:(2Fe-2S)-binding protein n=1 Tax=Streptomyces sp. AV19 TaxID=2793068 RepID=UPI0018FE9C3A|nr:(2Fe-2S)-binding protein [Streptomyces sp. AV19]MBH1937294.1 (2Fe-2S)-binding protein [Streptomyces sp. AV19]MDG4536772.1 (2Fe-2S)-binding protein [Streptomyces sp. AV19]
MRLHELASIGPFFALRTDDDELAGAGGYLPLDEGAVRLRVEAVGRRLGTDDRRIAASVAFQGITSRLLSIALGSATLAGRLPDLSTLRWQPLLTSPEDLWLPGAPLLPPAPDPAGQIATTVIDARLVPLHDLMQDVVPVSPRLMWGNAGSSLGGALRVLHIWCRDQGRPDDADRALTLARALFTHPLLKDTGVVESDAEGTPSFVRDTCCLYYRVPTGAGMCGDCVLRHPPRKRVR